MTCIFAGGWAGFQNFSLLGVVTTRTEGERVETWSTADYLAHALSDEKAEEKATG